MAYDEKIKEHLAFYKKRCLKIEKNGIYRTNKQEYPHILPEHHYKLNILETIRDEFWIYYWFNYWNNNEKKITLHPDFHHLNSSQAMCFNLFFPLILNKGNKDIKNIFFEYLNLKDLRSGIKDLQFEKVLCYEEFTNFDFFIKLNDGKKMLFEIKFSEKDFGKTDLNKSHKEKYEKIYKKQMKIEAIIQSKYTKFDINFKNNYQIIRNLSYLNKDTYVVFICPKENKGLIKKFETNNKTLEEFIKEDVLLQFQKKIRVIYLEDLVGNFINKFKETFPKLFTHYQIFKGKYII